MVCLLVHSRKTCVASAHWGGCTALFGQPSWHCVRRTEGHSRRRCARVAAGRRLQDGAVRQDPGADVGFGAHCRHAGVEAGQEADVVALQWQPAGLRRQVPATDWLNAGRVRRWIGYVLRANGCCTPLLPPTHARTHTTHAHDSRTRHTTHAHDTRHTTLMCVGRLDEH